MLWRRPTHTWVQGLTLVVHISTARVAEALAKVLRHIIQLLQKLIDGSGSQGMAFLSQLGVGSIELVSVALVVAQVVHPHGGGVNVGFEGVIVVGLLWKEQQQGGKHRGSSKALHQL